MQAHVLAIAREGSAEALWRLHFQLTPESCIEEVLEVVLKHLEVALVPNALKRKPGVDTLKSVQRALPCISMLSRLAAACKTNLTLKPTFISRIVEGIYGISAWSNRCIDTAMDPIFSEQRGRKEFHEVHIGQAEVFAQLLKVEPAILSAIYTETAFLKLLIRLWLAEDRNGEVFLDLEAKNARDGHLDCCPIIVCMMKVLAFDSARESLVDIGIARKVVRRPLRSGSCQTS